MELKQSILLIQFRSNQLFVFLTFHQIFFFSSTQHSMEESEKILFYSILLFFIRSLQFFFSYVFFLFEKKNHHFSISIWIQQHDDTNFNQLESTYLLLFDFQYTSLHFLSSFFYLHIFSILIISISSVMENTSFYMHIFTFYHIYRNTPTSK